MANQNEEHDYTFQLFAPNNNQAELIADFNDWKKIPMKKGDDGVFRVTRKLPDGVYQYRFNVQSKSWFYPENEWQTITDPYATDVDPPTQNAILNLDGGEKIIDRYIWRSNDVPLPANNQLVIYEMHVGDFSGGEADEFTRGKYTDVIAKLDYLTELGINAVELMPVKESPGDHSWGYTPVNYFASESNYGTTAQLKEMIDCFHSFGMRVIVDGVYNHANTESPLAQIDHDYWFRHEPRDKQYNWGPEFRYEYFDERFGFSPARKFIHDSLRFWISEYRIDGVRYDAAIQIGDFEVMREFVEITPRMSPVRPFLNIAEYLPPDPTLVAPDGPMDSCWNDSFMHIVTAYLTGDNFNLEEIKNALDCRRLGFKTASSVVNYIANHDHNRLFKLLGENGIFGAEAHRRARLGAVLLLTAVGIPMIWMGEEFGEYTEVTIDENKIHWQLLENPDNRRLFEHYKTLIALRKSHGALHTENIIFFHEDSENSVLAYHRFDSFRGEIVVVINLSETNLENYTINDFPAGKDWREITVNYQLEIFECKITLKLERREALIFVKS